jgi:hypothetical protein
MLFAYSANSRKNWRTPPHRCPDYWVGVGEPGNCYNIKGLGTCLSADIGEQGDNVIFEKNRNPNKYYYKNFNIFSDNCERQKWAKQCGIQWDGITYGYGTKNPCAKLT